MLIIKKIPLELIERIGYIPGKFATLSSAYSKGFHIVTNANLYSFSDGSPNWGVMSSGKWLTSLPTSDGLWADGMAFGRSTIEFKSSSIVKTGDFLAAYGVLVNNYSPVYNTYDSNFTSVRPRIAIGYNNSYLIIYICNGNDSCNLSQLADRVYLQGARYAINLDGGDSVKYKDKYQTFEQNPNRHVSGHFGVKILTELTSTIRFGDIGDSVTILQKALHVEGYPVTINGQFTQETLNAVKQVQSKYKLIVDGIVGKNTWTAMKLAY